MRALAAGAWDDEVFERIGRDYDVVFAGEVAQTQQQVEFIAQVLDLHPPQRVLDVCCGPGRHCLALARRGLRVTGVDRDPTLLDLGRRRAAAAGLPVRFIQADARRLPPLAAFDAAICMFTSWGYFRDPADNAAVLTSVAARLRPGARFLLDLPHVDWLAAHPVGSSSSVAGGTAVREQRSFDPATRRLDVAWRVRQPGALPWRTQLTYRVHTVAEMEWILASAGLVLEAAHGGFDGSVLCSASPRCLLLARRPVLPAR